MNWNCQHPLNQHKTWNVICMLYNVKKKLFWYPLNSKYTQQNSEKQKKTCENFIGWLFLFSIAEKISELQAFGNWIEGVYVYFPFYCEFHTMIVKCVVCVTNINLYGNNRVTCFCHASKFHQLFYSIITPPPKYKRLILRFVLYRTHCF